MSGFNIMEQAWRREPEAVCYAGYDMGVASDGQNIYFVGGDTSYDYFRVYDTHAQIMRTLPSRLPKRTRYAVLLNQKLFVFSNSLEVSICDLPSLTWTEGTPSDLAISGTGLAVIGNKIYFMGGRRQNTWENRVYDIITDEWNRVSSCPEKVDYASVAEIDGKIHMFGGSYSGQGARGKHYIYDIVADEWTTGPEMPYASQEGVVNSFDGKIYIFGGRSTSNGSAGYDGRLLIYDHQTETYTDGPALAEMAAFPHCVLARGRLYVCNIGKDDPRGMYSLQIGEDPGPIDPPGPGTGGSLARLGVTIPAGDTVQASVSMSLADNASYAFTSANPAVATVDSAGVVHAVAPGATRLQAAKADESFTESMPVRVTDSDGPIDPPAPGGDDGDGEFFMFIQKDKTGKLHFHAREINECDC